MTFFVLRRKSSGSWYDLRVRFSLVYNWLRAFSAVGCSLLLAGALASCGGSPTHPIQVAGVAYSFPVELTKANEVVFPAPTIKGIMVHAHWRFAGKISTSQELVPLTCSEGISLTATTQTQDQVMTERTMFLGSQSPIGSGGFNVTVKGRTVSASYVQLPAQTASVMRIVATTLVSFPAPVVGGFVTVSLNSTTEAKGCGVPLSNTVSLTHQLVAAKTIFVS